MPSNDFVRFLTEQFVSHFDRPKKERRENRKQRKKERPSFGNRWFGMVPAAMSFFVKNRFKR